MTDEEKVGQLFFQLCAGNSEEYLKELMEKYHLGGCRYNNMPGQYVQAQNRIMQKYAKIPVIIACNTEQGGSGAYDSNDDTMDALVDALISGPEAFKGQDPIDSFCGLWDTRL